MSEYHALADIQLNLVLAFHWIQLGTHEGTNKRRNECFRLFCAWILSELGCEVSEGTFPPNLMSYALIGYGKSLFYGGHPKYTYAETVNAVIDRFPHYRGLVSAAWQTLKKWEEAEPMERSMIMPAALFKLTSSNTAPGNSCIFVRCT